MRIGDLDALYDCVEARYRLSSGEEHKAERALLDAICEMPTIPAIPVEWLEAHRTEYFEDWGNEPVTIEQALIMWQKEQEAMA